MCYVTFMLLFKSGLGLLVGFNIKRIFFGKSKSPFTPESEMNKLQAEGKVNSCLYSRIQEKEVLHSSAIKNVSSSKVMFAY